MSGRHAPTANITRSAVIDRIGMPAMLHLTRNIESITVAANTERTSVLGSTEASTFAVAVILNPTSANGGRSTDHAWDKPLPETLHFDRSATTSAGVGLTRPRLLPATIVSDSHLSRRDRSSGLSMAR